MCVCVCVCVCVGGGGGGGGVTLHRTQSQDMFYYKIDHHKFAKISTRKLLSIFLVYNIYVIHAAGEAFPIDNAKTILWFCYSLLSILDT